MFMDPRPHPPTLSREPFARPVLSLHWRHRLRRILTCIFLVVAALLSFWVGRLWARQPVGPWLQPSQEVVLVFSYLVWLGLLFLTVAFLGLRLYQARDVEFLVTLPQTEIQVFWRKWASVFPTPLHAPSHLGWIVCLWCFLLGVGASWTTFLTLPLLVWSNLLALGAIAAWLTALGGGRSLALLATVAAAGTWILLRSLGEPAEAASRVGIDWTALRASFAYGPWSLLLPPRWALSALTAGGYQELATGATAGLTLGVSLLALAAAQARLRSTFTWRSLVERRETSTYRAPEHRPAAGASWLARYVEARLARRTRAVLRLTTQTPHPERRLNAVLPLILIWTATGTVVRLLEARMMPSLRAGDPESFLAFLVSFCLPLVLAFVLSTAVVLRGAPTVLPRGDARYPPVQALPVSFDEHLRIALLSLLLHLAGFALILLPFVLLVPSMAWSYAGLLVLGLWVVALDALGRAGGPRISPRRRFQRLRRIPFLFLGIMAAIFLVFSYLDAHSASWEPASWIYEHRWQVTLGAVAALPPVFALRFWYLRRQLVRRRFDVEGLSFPSLLGVHDEPSPFHPP